MARTLQKTTDSKSTYRIKQSLQEVTTMWPIFPRIVVYGLTEHNGISCESIIWVGKIKEEAAIHDTDANLLIRAAIFHEMVHYVIEDSINVFVKERIRRLFKSMSGCVSDDEEKIIDKFVWNILIKL
jgi:hypothetical protein